jgi:hypothetical protein
MNIYEYVFWYNHFTELWYAIPREESAAFFNDNNSSPNTIKSTKIETLIELLNKPQLAKAVLQSAEEKNADKSFIRLNPEE